MRFIGIDPGTTRIGYGVVDYEKDLSLVKYGVLEISASSDIDRLNELGTRFLDLLKSVSPDVAGVEVLYFAKNQKTALSVSQARGVILYLLSKTGIPIYEYGPNHVKQALTSYGASDKKAVALMVKKLLKIDILSGHDDASDALAIAITTAYSHGRFDFYRSG
ncbi:MAG: crossover junction endodeoxyribonuclease RuvC [Candidatus Harrisonbacteria bacterium CG10_big_fil_rev_8_21_14_0_10_40_38]|uniref:Crossover junction endodeoxyribonuclease RuvC n=1 Tax=Candidatus Harrisonbacteria bacterium CG10_big_fil_rev_8_21_14_0_10_40_38 TaxID=1974583 RepID=A0A2H0URC5_9BACT|nr:MAG: crossover junction endodeoxyribonuclease RuvC [Candidatus Harrisonbacteria bacterium CG10_big_fil_rev_8_21_14_0_10_40_38]